MSRIIIPIILIIGIIYALIKKINIYESFTEGVKEGLKITLGLFPTILAMILAINILVNSTILSDITIHLQSLFAFLKFPPELFPLAILRPISGSSSLMYLSSLLGEVGPDTQLGKIASIMQASTDTTIYILGLYFGAVQIKKIRHSLLVGLFTDFCVIILSIIVVRFLV